jgi:GGDEF domain-containing protein
VPDRRLLLGAAAAAYAAVFALVLTLDRPDLGVGRFFYVAVVLLALASGVRAGAAGGLLAALLYAVAVLVVPRLPDDNLLTLSMAIRVATYVGIGALIGFFAAQQQTLVEHFRVLAERDRLTGLPTSRSFEVELTQRLEAGVPFALLLGDVDGLGDRSEADERLHGLPTLLGRCLQAGDTIARVGPDEFAILVSCRSTEEAGALAAMVEAVLSAEGHSVTFGWSVSPRDGRNGLALYRAANERLYARKVIRRGDAAPTAAAG